MAKIGLIVYNLEDYANTGGLISTSKTGGIISSKNNELGYKNNKINIYSNLVPDSASFIKVGILAPPGTKAILNGKTILIGQNGIYELDEDIPITSLSFEQPEVFFYNETASQNKINDGKNGMRAAEQKRQLAIDELTIMPLEVVNENQELWDKYIKILNTFSSEYYSALALYREGMAGVYEKDTSNSGDLYNIIIDYVLEGGGV